jgi:hypothetical protein
LPRLTAVQNWCKTAAGFLLFSRFPGGSGIGRRRSRRFGVWALPLVLAASLALAAQEPGSGPDLSVAFISLTPRYPAYEVVYPDGLPQSLHPETGKPLAPEDAERVQRRPRPGERMTATARVVNHGPGASAAFQYSWLLDGKVVSTGRHGALEGRCAATADATPWNLKGASFPEAKLRPGTFADLTFQFPWRSKGQRLELRLQPEAASVEDPPENNRRAEQTDALSIAVLAHRSAYNAAPGFEDMVRERVRNFQARLEGSAYQGAISGVQQPLRIDTVRVLPDGTDLAAFSAVQSVNGWDASLLYGSGSGPPDLPVVLLPQLGLVARDAFSVTPASSEVRDTEESVRIGYRSPAPQGNLLLSEYEVLALNRMRGQRRGYRGAYLFDIPRSCRVRVLDNNGAPVAGAAVSVFQSDAGAVPADPVTSGTTGPNGAFPLPNRPAPPLRTETGFALRENPFGALRVTGDNGLLLLRITAGQQTEYQWLSIAQCNIAYWQGQTSDASFDLRTRIAPPGAPAAPAGLAATLEVVDDLPVAELQWAPSAAPDVAGYFLYRAVSPSFQWERAGAVSSARRRYSEPLPFPPETEVRYAVTAVSVQGNESALRAVAAPVRIP